MPGTIPRPTLPALRHLLAFWEGDKDDPESAAQRLQRASVDRNSGFPFHELPRTPTVILSIGCEPARANAVADLCGNIGSEW